MAKQFLLIFAAIIFIIAVVNVSSVQADCDALDGSNGGCWYNDSDKRDGECFRRCRNHNKVWDYGYFTGRCYCCECL